MPLNSKHLQPSASSTSTMQLSNQTAFAKLCADRAAASQSDGSSTRHVVVADASLPDLHILLAQLPPDTQVWLVHEEFDALGQIAQAVSQCHNLQGLHILGHGQPGRMLLGKQWVDAQTIARAGEYMVTLGTALADDAHIWLYGCHSAAGRIGEQWLDAWALATGVTVHGTDDVWHIHGAMLGVSHQQPSHNPLHDLWRCSGWAHTLAVNTAPTFLTGFVKAVVPPSASDGVVLVSVLAGIESEIGRSVIQQADGKLVAAVDFNNISIGVGVVRLNANGTLDTNFGSGGKLVLPVDSFGMSAVWDVIQLTDGKLVMAGTGRGVGASYSDFYLVRLNANGSLDSSFDGDGKLVLPKADMGNGRSIIQQADGKLVVAGYQVIRGDTGSGTVIGNDFALFRINADGSLDTGFGNGGELIIPVGSGDDYGYSVIQQADGKLVVAGRSYAGGKIVGCSLVRINTNGTLDVSFDGDGKLLLPSATHPLAQGQVVSIIQQTDGKLVVAGTGYSSVSSDFSLIRLNADGSLDTSFDFDGKLLVPMAPAPDANFQANSVFQQSDGKLVISGSGSIRSGLVASLLRLNTDGSVDTGFGSSGKLFVPFESKVWSAYSVIQQADGKLVMAGGGKSGTESAIGLVRVNTNGTIDTDFGKLFTTPPGASVAYTERGAATVLEAAAKVYDENLALSGYGGANVTLSRNGGANPQDVFIAKSGGTLAALIEGGALVVSGTTIGTVTTNSGGILKLTFNNNAIELGPGSWIIPQSQTLFNSALQQIAYKNDSLWQNTSIQIDWTFSDGNTGAQGTGGALTATGNVTVNVAAINDLLVLDPSASPTLPTVTEKATNPAGISVAGLVVDGSIFDDDKPNPVEAIVIEAVGTGVGTWQFSLNGGATWLNIQADLLNSTTNTIGLALGPTALIRLLPFGDLSQTASSSITFRAWDQSDGNPSGSYFVFAPGVGSVSAANDVATASVTAVNGAPAPELPNGTGKVIVPTAIDDSARSVVVQPDGKIVMAGLAYTGIDWDFAVTRLNADGRLDSSFGSGGKTTFGVGIGDDWGQTILARPDGKFVVAGYAINGVTDYFAVAQLNADGSLDMSFGIGGKAVVALGKADRTLHQYLYSGQIAALQPDGKIVLGGSYNLNGAAYGYDFAVARLNTNGSLDSSFGTNGRVFIPGQNGNDLGQSVLVMPNGDILVAGSSGMGTDFDFATVRVNSSGNLVSTWGPVEPWKSFTGVGTGNDYGTSFAVQTDGRVVMAGRVLAGSGEELAFSGIDDDYGIVRFLANGELDSGFGIGGKVIVQMGLFNGGAFGVILQPDSKILVAGNALNGSDDDFGILRLNSNGTLDTTFGNGGKVIVQVGVNTGDFAHSVTVQPDGKIVVAGTSFDGISPNFSVIRLNADGSLDTSLGSTSGGNTFVPMSGTTGNDTFTSRPGNDIIEGGAGIDTAIFNGSSINYLVTKSGGTNTVQAASGTDGTVTLQNVERLKFTDTTIALDIDGNGGQAYRVYQAAFNRTPDSGGLGFWIHMMDGGASLRSVAEGFVGSAEFKAIYGTNPTNAQIVTKLYDNVLHRPGETGGYNFWLGVLDSKAETLAGVLAAFSESAENQAGLVGVIGNGFAFTPFV